jgi:hypothetical protein
MTVAVLCRRQPLRTGEAPAPPPSAPPPSGCLVCRRRMCRSAAAARRASVLTRASLAPGGSRVELQAARAVAVDVEYVHVRLVGADARYSKRQLPAEVCLVDSTGAPMVLTKIDAIREVVLAEGQELVYDGGIRLEEVRGQPLLSEVRELLVATIGDRLVVGHNLAKDLLALGMTAKMVPVDRRRDTMMYAALQNEKGCGRSLAELAELKLGRKIQRGDRHSSEEDARATMELYLGWCHFDERLMGYDDLVEYQTSRILAGRGGGINERM